MASRGSVIPLFLSQLSKGIPLTITDPKMTRFMMTLEEAVELVLYAFKITEKWRYLCAKRPAATISTLLELF